MSVSCWLDLTGATPEKWTGGRTGEVFRMENQEQRGYLETSFWDDGSENENSDDEGIGSDESMDQTEQCSCDTNKDNDKTNDNQKSELEKSKPLINQSKDPLRVTKFLRILKQSMVSNSSPVMARRRVFGEDLSSHLDSSKTLVPQIMEWCTRTIEERGKDDMKNLEGVYRLSGQVSHIKALKLSFDTGRPPTKHETINIHSVGSLLKVIIFYSMLDRTLFKIPSYISVNYLNPWAPSAFTPTLSEVPALPPPTAYPI